MSNMGDTCWEVSNESGMGNNRIGEIIVEWHGRCDIINISGVT